MAEASRPAEALLEADAAVAGAVAPYQDNAGMRALGRFASLGDQPPLRGMCGGLIAAGLIAKDRKLVRAGLRMLIAHTAATMAKDFIKRRVDRTRPRSLDDDGAADHRLSAGNNEAKEESSFPSGHSAGAMAVAAAFAREYPEQAAVALGAGGSLSLAQIPRCAHYPTDVAAGVWIGVAAEAVTSAVFDAAERKLDERFG